MNLFKRRPKPEPNPELTTSFSTTDVPFPDASPEPAGYPRLSVLMTDHTAQRLKLIADQHNTNITDAVGQAVEIADYLLRAQREGGQVEVYYKKFRHTTTVHLGVKRR